MQRIRWRAKAVLLLFLAAVLSGGCGYALLGRGGSFPEGVKKVAVATFKNRTNRYGLEGEASSVFIQELMSTGKVTISNRDEADAWFEGVLTGYDTTPIAITAQREVRERRITITGRVEFKLREGAKPFFAEDGLQGQAEYPVSENLARTSQAEKDAARRALKDMADRVISRLIEGF